MLLDRICVTRRRFAGDEFAEMMGSGSQGSMLADVRGDAAREQFAELFASPLIRIERIVSMGHASPRGFWYDQPMNEWVLLLSGSARLRLHGETQDRSMQAGDYLLIPAHVRHRVEWTAPDQPTIWLAVHFGD